MPRPPLLPALCAMLATFAAAPVSATAQSYGETKLLAETPGRPATHVKAKLVADRTSVAPGDSFRLALVLDHPSHWHTYWKNPGDAGSLTSIAWTTDSGAKFGDWRYPAPHLYATADILNFVFEGRAVILIPVTAPASLKPGDTFSLEGTAEWLECDDSSCHPGSAKLSLRIPVTDKGVPADAELFDGAEKKIPAAAPAGTASLEITGKETATLRIAASALTGRDAAKAVFFPESESVPAAAVKTKPVADKAGVAFAFTDVAKVVETKRLAGALVFAPGDALAIDVSAGQTPAAATSVAFPASTTGADPVGAPQPETDAGVPLLLLLAFGGGILLNIMPCVFPVLGLKIYGFVNKAHADKRKVVTHALVFAAGIVASFWALAGIILGLKSGAIGLLGANGADIGWGFLQQIPAFNAAVAAVFLIMGLSMAGVFEFGTGVQNAAGSVEDRGGYFGSFLSGALATLVATPCTGPLMAPALTAAFGGTAVMCFAIFTALGVGLALPFVVLAANPALLKKLPRPGAWMESFKQGMSFAIFGAFAYFLWVVISQTDELPPVVILPPGLTLVLAAVLIALACWIYGRWCGPSNSTRERRTGGVIAGTVMLAALGSSGMQLAAKTPRAGESVAAGIHEIVWEAWSPERQKALLAEGRTVYVDFTAKWCATCLVNKRVYHEEAVMRAFADKKIVALKADWTNRNDTIAKELKTYGRVAIPFNVVLKNGEQPKPLPSLLTGDAVLGALGAK